MKGGRESWFRIANGKDVSTWTISMAVVCDGPMVECFFVKDRKLYDGMDGIDDNGLCVNIMLLVRSVGLVGPLD